MPVFQDPILSPIFASFPQSNKIDFAHKVFANKLYQEC